MSYIHILTRLQGTPLLMHETKLQTITEAVTIPLLLGREQDIQRVEMNSLRKEREIPDAPAKLAIIPVFDSLVSKSIHAGSGMTSYQEITERINNAVSVGVTDILFYVDTPGGEPSSLFGLTAKIRELASKGITTHAFTDGWATSAGYAIFAAAANTYASPVSVLGSIAALMVHADTSKKDSESGITYTILQSKSEKALGNSKEPLSEAAKEKFLAHLAILDKEFNIDISTSRTNLSVDAIVGLKGATFLAEEAKSLGLVDNIAVSLESVIDTIFSKKSVKPKGVKMETEKELLAKLEAAEATITTLKAEHAAAVTLAVEGERTRCLTILETAATHKMSQETAIRHLKSGYSAEVSAEMMLDIVSERTEASAISGSAELSTVDKSGNKKESVSEMRSALKIATGY